jgi:hypothetical protein
MSSPNQALLQVMHGSRRRIARVCLSLYPLAHYIMDTAQALRPATLALPLPTPPYPGRWLCCSTAMVVATVIS